MSDDDTPPTRDTSSPTSLEQRMQLAIRLAHEARTRGDPQLEAQQHEVAFRIQEEIDQREDREAMLDDDGMPRYHNPVATHALPPDSDDEF